MGRILFFILAASALWFAWTVRRRRNALDREERSELERLREKEKRENERKKHYDGEPMVKCDGCGVYFPKKEAVLRKSRVYCSEECRNRSEGGI